MDQMELDQRAREIAEDREMELEFERERDWEANMNVETTSYLDETEFIACTASNIITHGSQNLDINGNITVKTSNDKKCISGKATAVSPQYGFFTKHATQTSATNHTFTRPDILKTIQREDGEYSPTIKQAFSNPQTSLVTSENYSEGLVSDQRVCGVGQFAQNAPPGTKIKRSYANPKIEFPSTDENGDLNPSDFPDGYYAWGGTLYVYRRGEGVISADANGLSGENSDLACYTVPNCPEETKANGGRCFCMGVDFTNGYPPSKDWDQIAPCLEKFRCLDWDTNTNSFDTTMGEADASGMVMWQFGSTEAFSGVPHPKDVADQMEYRHGVCNPMAQKDVLATIEFTKRLDVQVDDIGTLRDELSLEIGEIVEKLSFSQDTPQGFASCVYRNGLQPDAAIYGTGYTGSWVYDTDASTLDLEGLGYSLSEMTAECNAVGYSSCGFAQYVNEGTRPSNQIADGRSCGEILETGSTCNGNDTFTSNGINQCVPDNDTNVNACMTCENSIMPAFTFAISKFAQIAKDGAPPPEDPRTCRYARFFMEGENAPLEAGLSCSSLQFNDL